MKLYRWQHSTGNGWHQTGETSARRARKGEVAGLEQTYAEKKGTRNRWKVRVPRQKGLTVKFDPEESR
jgi:hypothetical protein